MAKFLDKIAFSSAGRVSPCLTLLSWGRSAGDSQRVRLMATARSLEGLMKFLNREEWRDQSAVSRGTFTTDDVFDHKELGTEFHCSAARPENVDECGIVPIVQNPFQQVRVASTRHGFENFPPTVR